MLRIITGTKKGKRIETLEGEATRPTTDKVKEAIFSSLQFDIEGRRVLDLFAGSGQLGFEALSRGAESVMFVDSAREAIDIVKKNARSLELFDNCRYLVSDYRNYIRKARSREPFELVFIDPPYAMECCTDALIRLRDASLLARGAIVVLESGSELIDTEALLDFEVLKSKSYGKKINVNILLYRGSGE